MMTTISEHAIEPEILLSVRQTVLMQHACSARDLQVLGRTGYAASPMVYVSLHHLELPHEVQTALTAQSIPV